MEVYGHPYIRISSDPDDCIVKLPKGTIEKLFGRKITWEHYPIKIEF